MKIGILPFRKEKNIDGLNRVTQTLVKEILKIDHKNDYSFIGSGRFLGIDIPEKKIIPDSWNVMNLNSCVMNEQYDIVHSNYYSFYVNKKLPCARILTIHDLNPESIKIYGDNWRKTVPLMDQILADSNHTKKDIVNLFNVNPDKVRVIYNGMFKLNMEYDEKNISERIKKLTNQPYIMTVSTLREYKNMIGLVRAFILFKELHKDSDLNLILVGKDFKNNSVRMQIGELCSGRNDVVFTGYVSDEELVYLYKNCLATGFVSFFEGFGLPVLEALYYGKTVICSNATSLPEVGGDAVEYCDPHDVESIEYAFERVVLDDNNRQKLEKLAAIQASKFSYEKMARETLDVYKQFE